MSRIWMSHVTHRSESRHIYNRVMSHIRVSHVTHMSESCHTYAWVMSHIWVTCKNMTWLQMKITSRFRRYVWHYSRCKLPILFSFRCKTRLIKICNMTRPGAWLVQMCNMTEIWVMSRFCRCVCQYWHFESPVLFPYKFESRLIKKCDMTHTDAWLVQMCDMTKIWVTSRFYMCVWSYSCLPASFPLRCKTWQIQICDMTHSEACLVQMCDMTHSRAWHLSFTFESWLHSPASFPCVERIRSYVWHHSLTCVTRRIHVCDMTH